jgi:hypothetical protein
MITILGSVTEIKSEVRAAKEEILKALEKVPAAATPAPINDNTDEFAKMVVQEVGSVRVFVQESIESLKADMMALLDEMTESITEVATTTPVSPPPAPAMQPVPSPAPTPAPTPAPAAAPEQPPAAAAAPISIPADRAMKVADQLTIILKSLKMGCVAGEVLDTMTGSKAEIMKIVPSDPIMVKMDKWMGTVSAYPKRKELQARDILKLKKDIKAEIPKYRPA